MRCQTWLKGASMTADSRTEVEVGIVEAILIDHWDRGCTVWFESGTNIV